MAEHPPPDQKKENILKPIDVEGTDMLTPKTAIAAAFENAGKLKGAEATDKPPEKSPEGAERQPATSDASVQREPTAFEPELLLKSARSRYDEITTAIREKRKKPEDFETEQRQIIKALNDTERLAEQYKKAIDPKEKQDLQMQMMKASAELVTFKNQLVSSEDVSRKRKPRKQKSQRKPAAPRTRKKSDSTLPKGEGAPAGSTPDVYENWEKNVTSTANASAHTAGQPETSPTAAAPESTTPRNPFTAADAPLPPVPEVPVPPISPEAAEAEREEQQAIDANIAARHATEAPPEQKQPAEKIGVNFEYDQLRKRFETRYKASFPNGTRVPKELEGEYIELKRRLAKSFDPSDLENVRNRIEEFLGKLPASSEVFVEEPEGLRIEPPIRPGGDPEIAAQEPSIEPVVPDPTNAADRERVQQIISGNEGTPAENRSSLKAAVERLLSKTVAATKEKVEWWKSSEEGLIRRSQDLDQQLEKIGGVEKGFRWLGENYNKLGWKSKLGVGLALGIGAGVGSAVSMPAAIACLSGIAVQRTAGLATMYLKYEKSARLEDKWGKEKAMAKAILYSAAMTAGTLYAVKEISESEWPHRVKEWMGDMLGHRTMPPEVLPAAPVPAAPEAPPVAETVSSPAGAEVAAPAPEAPQAEIPQIAVEVAPGKGYEWMAKQAWEQLQGKGIIAHPGSDLETLLKADKDTINKVIHELAERHGFFKPDGTSVQINLGDKLIINDEGNLALVRGDQTFAGAPEGARITESQPFQSVEVRPPPPEIREMIENAKAAAEAESAEPEPAAPSTEPEKQVAEAAPKETVYGVEAQQPPAPVEEAKPVPRESVPDNVWKDSEGNPVTTEDGKPVTAGFEPTTEVPTTQTPDVIKNTFGLEIPLGKAHIYAGEDAAHVYAFGGTPLERAQMIEQYLKENPNRVVFAADDTGQGRLPWYMVNGKLTSGGPMRTSGLFGFGSTWMKPPGPEDLQKLIK